MRLSLSFILLLSAVIILMLLIARSEVGHRQFSSSRKKSFIDVQARDSDSDGIDDSVDLDDDNDGKETKIQLKINLWSLTGIPDAEDPDDDYDGIPDIGKNIFLNNY